MGDREGSGVNEPPCDSLKKAKEVGDSSSEKVETEAHDLGKRGSREGFNYLEMVWYEENREKAEHGVMEFPLQSIVIRGFSSDSEDRCSPKLRISKSIRSDLSLTKLSKAHSHFRGY